MSGFNKKLDKIIRNENEYFIDLVGEYDLGVFNHIDEYIYSEVVGIKIRDITRNVLINKFDGSDVLFYGIRLKVFG